MSNSRRHHLALHDGWRGHVEWPQGREKLMLSKARVVWLLEKVGIFRIKVVVWPSGGAEAAEAVANVEWPMGVVPYAVEPMKAIVGPLSVAYKTGGSLRVYAKIGGPLRVASSTRGPLWVAASTGGPLEIAANARRPLKAREALKAHGPGRVVARGTTGCAPNVYRVLNNATIIVDIVLRRGRN